MLKPQAPNGTMRAKLWHRKGTATKPILVKDELTGLKNILKNPKTVFFGSNIFIDGQLQLPHHESLKCQLYRVPRITGSMRFATAFPKDSEFLGIYNFYLQKNIQNGAIHRRFQKWYPSIEAHKDCPRSASIGLDKTISLLVLHSVLTFVSAGIFVIEFYKKPNQAKLGVCALLNF